MQNTIKLLQLLQKDRSNVTFDWLTNKDMVVIFKKYNISPSKFLNNFGNKIYNYILSSIEQQSDFDDKEELVVFLKIKSFLPSEIFTIFNSIKKTIINFTTTTIDLKNTLFNHKITDILDDLTKDILDLFTNEINVLNTKLKSNIQLLEQYKKAIDSSSIVSKADSRGFITYTNTKLEEISGFTKNELLGKPHSILRHPETPSELFKDLWNTIQNKKIWHGKIKNLKKNGGYYIVDAFIIPILDNNNEIQEYISVRHDITEEEILRNILLDDKMISIEAQHIQDTNQKITQVKDDFLIVFTHELKTPLNAIINFSKYISKHIKKADISNKDELIELSDDIISNSYDMLEHVSDILEISKLKSNKMVFTSCEFCINTTIEKAITKAKNKIKKDVEITKEVENYYHYFCDQERFSHVLYHLISNAIKYSKSKVLLTIKKIDNSITVSVEDDGVGIKNKSKVFQLFEQEIDTIKRTSEGTGIGLHYVKLLCDSMKISIEAKDSKRLGGAMFLLSKKI